MPVTVAWGVHDRLLLYRRQAPRARTMLALGAPPRRSAPGTSRASMTRPPWRR